MRRTKKSAEWTAVNDSPPTSNTLLQTHSPATAPIVITKEHESTRPLSTIWVISFCWLKGVCGPSKDSRHLTKVWVKAVWAPKRAQGGVKKHTTSSGTRENWWCSVSQRCRGSSFLPQFHPNLGFYTKCPPVHPFSDAHPVPGSSDSRQRELVHISPQQTFSASPRGSQAVSEADER